MRERRDLRIKKIIDVIGAILFVLGLAGLGGAAEGQGNIIVASIVFALGFGLTIWGYQFN